MRWVLTPSIIWVLLLGLTMSSVGFFEAKWLGPATSMLIVAIAAVKARLVIVHFMEVKRASRHWRWLYDAWIAAAAASIAIGGLVGSLR